jgi:hypothetical protein
MLNNEYAELYIGRDMRIMSLLFEYSDTYSKQFYNKKVSRVRVVEKFMQSYARQAMDELNPKLLSQAAADTFCLFVDDDLQGNIELLISNEEDAFFDKELYWIGMMYAYIRFKWETYSTEVYKELPLEKMRRFYIWGHQMGYVEAYERLMDLKNK